MTHVVTVTRQELLKRRSELLERVGSSLPDLAARARSGDLVDEEWPIWSDLCEIQFLLREDLEGRPVVGR